jgi:hypothetical protein
MVIRLRIDKADPLTGSAATDERRPLPFEGWIELLGVLSELVNAPATSEPVDKNARRQRRKRR